MLIKIIKQNYLVIFLIIGIFQIFDCKVEKRYVDEGGIKREYLQSVDKQIELTKKYDYTSNECNIDNEIYIPNKEFHYQVVYIKDRDTLQIAIENGSWKFYKKANPNCLKTIGMEIKEGNLQGMTISKFNYYLNNGLWDNFEQTGIVENKKNVWIHPPRSSFFRILEINPFPYIKFPYKKGITWEWELLIGDRWSSPSWKAWTGQITNKYYYEIKGKKIMETNFGKLEVIIIHCVAKSRIGQTELVSYFNEKHGFMKLDYLNIDSTKIVMELLNVR